MKQIKCELCGSITIIKDGDFFVCQHCGCKYTLEAAQKLVVEIAGFETADVLFQRAKDFENLKEWSMARKTYIEMTQKYPCDYRGWLGLIIPIERNATITYEKVIRCLDCKRISYSDVDGYFGETCKCGASFFEKGYEDTFPRVQEIKIDGKILKNAYTCATEEQRREIEAVVEVVKQKNEKVKQKCENILAERQRKWALAEEWGFKNGVFLNQFTNGALIKRFGMNCQPHEVKVKLTRCERAYNIKILYAYENLIKGICYRDSYSGYPSKKSTGRVQFTYKIPNNDLHIEGDIRPSMDGLEVVSLFRKKRYDYEMDKIK